MIPSIKITHNKCGHVLGTFSPQDDHSGVDVFCPCGQWISIHNGRLAELIDNPGDYDLEAVKNEEVGYETVQVPEAGVDQV